MVDTWTQIPPLGTPHDPEPDPEFTVANTDTDHEAVPADVTKPDRKRDVKPVPVSDKPVI